MPGRDDPVDELKRSKYVDPESFQDRVREEAEVIRTHLRRGTFDCEQVTVGLEYEFYAVDRSGKHVRRLPRNLLECLGFEKELGLHNAGPCLDARFPTVEGLNQDIGGKPSDRSRVLRGIPSLAPLARVGPAQNPRAVLALSFHQDFPT